MLSIFTTGAIVVIVVILLVLLIMSGYTKAQPDRIFIRSGLRKTKEFTGKAFFKIPFLERVDKLTLELIPIDVKTSSPVPTADCIQIMVDAVCVIQVDTSIDPETGKRTGVELAARNFLNDNLSDIEGKVRQTLEGNMREIVASMELKEMINDRKRFGSLVDANAKEDLARMGLTIVSFNVQNFKDDNKVIDNLGVNNTQRIQKDAEISRAEATRDIRIAQANAEKEAMDAKVASEQAIAEKQNELAIKKARLQADSDAERAKADAAYKIQEQEQMKTINIATTNAEIEKQRKEVELKEQLAIVTEKQLDAEERKKADADLYKKQKEYEADTYRAEQAAKAAKAQADAELYKRQKEAEGIALVGKAEAEAIAAKGLAEAEALEKKAEAQAKMGNASVLDMYFEVLPEVARAVAEPLSKVGNITMYGDGNNTKLVGDITNTMTQVLNGVKDSTGLDVSAVLNGFLGAKLGEQGTINKLQDIMNQAASTTDNDDEY